MSGARQFNATPEVIELAHYAKLIEESDEYAAKVGAKLADLLGVKFRKSGVRGEQWTEPRIVTAWGSKTAPGLARTVLRILSEPAQ